MAHKSCQINATTLLPVWSKTNFSFCMTYDESDLCRNDTCNIEVIFLLLFNFSVLILLNFKHLRVI